MTLKILLSYCTVNSYLIDQMDVDSAFLNGPVKTEIYIKQPKGYALDPGKVCKLEKALYGLRESLLYWYETFDNHVKNLGFKRSSYDNCLYVKRANRKSIYLLVFVDDLLICADNQNEINEIKKSLMSKFTMKDLGKAKSYVGIEIYYDRNKGEMFLSQKQYIESLCAKYVIENSKRYETAMENNLKIDQAVETDETIKFRNLIGELFYLSTGTRPDVTYSVNYLSRFQQCYNKTHFKYPLRVLKYLINTKNLRLKHGRDNLNKEIDCYVDSDFAGDTTDKKSTSG